MSDLVQVALISALSTAFPSILSAFFAYRASIHAKKAVEISQLTEKNTNSMKDELVNLTDKEAFARGQKSERDRR